MPKSTLLMQGRFYLPTFFQGDYGDASRRPEERSSKCVLLIRDIRLWRTPKGKRRLDIKTAGLEFPDEQAMNAAIEEQGMEPLPPEADGNPRYLPVEYRALEHSQ